MDIMRLYVIHIWLSIYLVPDVGLILSMWIRYSRVRVIYVRVIYDGTGNFQTFWRKPIVTQIRVIYNFLGTGNFEPDIFEKVLIPLDLN